MAGCGPSTPFKGLIAEHPTNVHQDRFVASSGAAAANENFRSSGQPSSGGVDVDFAVFSHAHPLAGAVREEPARVAPLLLTEEDKAIFRRERQQHLEDQAHAQAHYKEWKRGYDQNKAQLREYNRMSVMAARAGAPVNAKPPQYPEYVPWSRKPEHHTHYPEEMRLANTTEEALQAAFASYDADFEKEMDEWLESHGPKERPYAVMRQLAAEQDEARAMGDPTFFPQSVQQNRELLAKKKAADGVKERNEIRDAAYKIHTAMANSGNEKFTESAFYNLNNRLFNAEVIIRNDCFWDTKTNAPYDPDNSPPVRGPVGMGSAGQTAAWAPPPPMPKTISNETLALRPSAPPVAMSTVISSSAARPLESPDEGKGKGRAEGPF